MEINKIDQIVSSYVGDNFSPTDEEMSYISEQYKQLQAILVGVDIFQTGSYARLTAITPVNDLDVIWVIPEQEVKKLLGGETINKVIQAEEIDVHDIINDLANKLKGEYKKIGEQVAIKPQTHSVGIYFGADDEFSIDVVPAIELPGKNEDFKLSFYKVPNILKFTHKTRQKKYASGENITWIKSDPRGYKKQAQALEENTDGSFRKTVKLIKKWRQGCKMKTSNFKLKSFHLEMIITNYLLENSDAGIYKCLVWFYGELPTFLIRAQINDRADSKRYIDEYVTNLTEQQKVAIRSYKDKAIEAVGKISQANSEDQVISAIKELVLINTTRTTSNPPPTYSVGSGSISRPWIRE